METKADVLPRIILCRQVTDGCHLHLRERVSPMKNRKREICTSGSVRDEDGQPPHLLGRRNFLHLAAGAAAFSAVSSIAWAQSYPARTVTIIVPFAAGGTTDVAARIIGEYMSQLLGQQFIVENVTGAGGTTGSTRAVRARPDGYTLLMGHTGTHAFSVALYPNLAYKPAVDFEPIGTVLENPLLIVARRDFPPKDLKEFIAYAKANAEKLNVAHGGVGGLLVPYA